MVRPPSVHRWPIWLKPSRPSIAPPAGGEVVVVHHEGLVGALLRAGGDAEDVARPAGKRALGRGEAESPASRHG